MQPIWSKRLISLTISLLTSNKFYVENAKLAEACQWRWAFATQLVTLHLMCVNITINENALNTKRDPIISSRMLSKVFVIFMIFFRLSPQQTANDVFVVCH